MGLIDGIKSFLGIGSPSGSIGGSGGTFSSPGDNYMCASCRSTFKRQHHQCPECGGPILVPIEETEEGQQGRGGGPLG